MAYSMDVFNHLKMWVGPNSLYCVACIYPLKTKTSTSSQEGIRLHSSISIILIVFENLKTKMLPKPSENVTPKSSPTKKILADDKHSTPEVKISSPNHSQGIPFLILHKIHQHYLAGTLPGFGREASLSASCWAYASHNTRQDKQCSSFNKRLLST